MVTSLDTRPAIERGYPDMKRLQATFSTALAFTAALSLVVACTPAAPTGPTNAPAAPPTAPPTFQSLPASGLTTPSPAAGASPAASPSASPAAAATRGGGFIEAATSDAVSFHPYLTTDTASSGYEGFVYGGSLWRYNRQSLQPEPEAAK